MGLLSWVAGVFTRRPKVARPLTDTKGQALTNERGVAITTEKQ